MAQAECAPYQRKATLRALQSRIASSFPATFTSFDSLAVKDWETVVPIAFPLIAGSGTLTTIMSLKANYGATTLLIAILVNLVIIYVVLKSLGYIAKLLGPSGLSAVRKFFGVILLAIAVKIFATNAPGLIK